MKKTLALLCAFVAAPLWGTAERPLKATLTEARGDVQVSAAPDQEWEPAEAGITLGAEARLKTGPDSDADLLFEDGTAMHVDKNASLTLESAREKSDGTREFSIRLWAGRLLSQVMKRERSVSYRVRTPVAVAAVRGTEFVTDAAEDATELAVFEGQVETTSLKDDAAVGEAVLVAPDQEISLAGGRPAGAPRALSRAMGDYRRANAARFRARIDTFRRDTARVQRLREDFMERRRRRMEEAMEQGREGNARKMRDFRKRLRQRQQGR